MAKMIKIGHYLRKGVSGDILGDYEKYKACNFCIHFRGYGWHWVAGHCKFHEGDIVMFDYSKTAKGCENFDCKKELLVEDGIR